MLVVFVHGWGVMGSDYGALPSWLSSELGAETAEIWLADYISYDNEVTMDDLVRAFERARQEKFPAQEFACVTHSTGGPVIREWLQRYERNRRGRAGKSWLTHLVALAPPNHGSTLAQLGKGRLSRMAFWIKGGEPGEKVLDWLELGSQQSWDLNLESLDIDWTERGVYQFVLAGGTHDPKLYDHLNSYTGEVGSDGVVRVAAANPNYRLLTLEQNGAGELEPKVDRRSPQTAFGILRRYSHVGNRKGILSSITKGNAKTHPVALWVARCLGIDSAAGYRKVAKLLELESVGATKPCSMIVFRLHDSSGNTVPNYDLLLTSGKDFSPDDLPRGFFIDRQRNQQSRSVLTYYLDHNAMSRADNLGLKIFPQPDSGPVHYQPAEFRSKLAQVEKFLRPNETVMVNITLNRVIEQRVFEVRRSE